MNFNFLKIDNISDLLSKYSTSWLTTAGLTIATPKMEIYLPLLIQFAFIILTQMVAFGVDFLRLVYLKQKSKTKIFIEANKVNIESEILEVPNEEKKEIRNYKKCSRINNNSKFFRNL